jgi:uncharacterized protein (DUF427 family)
VVPTSDRIRVVHRGVVIADTVRAVRVLETSQPPAYYIHPDDTSIRHLVRGRGRSFCEWKGPATYWSVRVSDGGVDDIVEDAAWSYEAPTAPFASIAGYLAFYAQKLDECWVGDEQVRPNPGSFYGGWITSRVVGPFKGDPGTEWW